MALSVTQFVKGRCEEVDSFLLTTWVFRSTLKKQFHHIHHNLLDLPVIIGLGLPKYWQCRRLILSFVFVGDIFFNVTCLMQ